MCFCSESHSHFAHGILFLSTAFALKSDRHDDCSPRDAPRRFFEVLFLGHTFIVSGQFTKVPVFRVFRSAY